MRLFVQQSSGKAEKICCVSCTLTAFTRIYTQINVHVDDSVDTGVYAPASITVSDGNATSTFPVTDLGGGAAPFWVNLNVSGLGLSGNTVFITLNRINTNNGLYV